MKIIFAFLALLLTLGGHAQDANRRTQDANGRTRDANFIAPPYLQIGRTPSPGSLDLLWQTKDAPGEWKVEWKSATGGKWQTLPPATVTRVAPAGLAPRLLYKTSFTGLTPGALFDYRVRRDGRIIFTAAAHALKAADQSFRLIVSGDIGAATPDAKLLAQQAWLAKPDLFVIPGDIIYENGRVSEYDTNFWPVYNADSSTPSGAPLMRSIAFVGAPGNHDLDNRSLDQFPDGLAYFYFWDQPLNGPEGREGNAFVPPLKASDSNRAAFIRAAGDAYPRMANYSFDYGNTHWTVIDSDPYVDWTDKGLCDWVAKDLAAATQATWRFVVFHHPGFNSSREHYEQQQMRLLSPIFEKGSVDIVFCGHVHNYQRSYPLTFLPDR
ncbi:MAG TPA: metallophosphoesterase family protein, partial [Puia sp.]|nr:metallophosphoesterase family protein [Puia sp.]